MLKLLGFLLLASMPSCASELVLGDFKTDLIPHPVPYAVLLPDGFKDGPALPMLMMLHGGNSSREELVRMRGVFDQEWKSGRLPKMVVAMMTAGPACMYMDFKDGSEKWESLITGPFRIFVQTTYNASADPRKNLLMGVSMGGEGTLRIGLKHPELYGGIAAISPGLQPVLSWKDVTPAMHWWITDEQMQAAYGKPIDPAYWEANNPNGIVMQQSQRILDSGMQIYLSVGDDDSMLFTGPVEHFHQMLLEHGIKHEYHVVHGGDHFGRMMDLTLQERLEFLGRVVNPPGPDPMMQQFREAIAPMKKKFALQ
jgi:S-formylglutathione hydrolase